jgi:hypothetical protein
MRHYGMHYEGIAMAITAQTSTITPSQIRTAFPAVRADRTVLDGGWWPRSYDAAAELPGLVELLGDRFGPIRQLLLSSAVWEGRFRRLAVGPREVRVGWFTSVDPGLLVATTDRGDQIDLLVVPPQTSEADAKRALATAADPANRKRPAAIL